MPITVAQPEEKSWSRRLLPLPHEVAISEKVVCRPAEVAIRLTPNAGEVECHAASELRALFLSKAGVRSAGSGFEIRLGVVDAQGRLDGIPVDQAERLRTLPNREQAYAIQPHDGSGLLLAGQGEWGVCYAARTLHQLIEPFLSHEQAVLPLARILDWPDMEERGLWNFPNPERWVPWLASLKLNFGKMASTKLQTVERGRPNRATIDADLLREGRLKAFNYLPYVLHLNFLHDAGLFRAYPKLAGKGDSALAGRYFAHKQGNQHRAPCASNPLLKDILAEWMADIAAQGADEVSCWLSERPAQCGCAPCTAVGQFVLETRAFVAAWREVQKRHPGFRIRIFSSTTTTERNFKVLAELPPEVKFERACATELERVPHLPRDLAANPLLDSAAAEGRWIASYDVPLTVNARVDTPEFKLPTRSAHRVRDSVRQLVRRRWAGAYGMMAWANHAEAICGFNIAALAEWSWNLNGRSEREFATAWATREGHEAPDQVGKWADLVGPVEFDVYDSDFPIAYSWGKFIDLVRDRRRPCLGEGLFRYYESPSDFDRKIAACEEALGIASGFRSPDLAHETRIVRSYVRLAKCLYEVADRVSSSDLSRLEDQEMLRRSLGHLNDAGTENVSAIRTWRSALGPEPWHPRVHDAISATEMTVREIVRFLSEHYFF